jgi:hypothetical protein
MDTIIQLKTYNWYLFTAIIGIMTVNFFFFFFIILLFVISVPSVTPGHRTLHMARFWFLQVTHLAAVLFSTKHKQLLTLCWTWTPRVESPVVIQACQIYLFCAPLSSTSPPQLGNLDMCPQLNLFPYFLILTLLIQQSPQQSGVYIFLYNARSSLHLS